jgi:hypothetical protein
VGITPGENARLVRYVAGLRPRVSKSSYARAALLEKLERDEEGAADAMELSVKGISEARKKRRTR